MSPRARLAILCGAVLPAASAMLLAIPNLFAGTKIHAAASSPPSGADPAPAQHVADVHRLLTAPLIALGVLLAVSIPLGWFLPGRPLRRRAARAPSTASDSSYAIRGRQ